MNLVLSSSGALKNRKESARITLFLLAEELKEQGHDLRIILNGPKCQEEIQGFSVYRSPMLGIPLLLRQLHREKKIDIVHSFSASPLFILPHLWAPGKLVHSLKSYPRSKSHRQNVFRQLGYHFLRFADAITVPTTTFAQTLSFNNKVHVVHSPIDTRKFYPKKKEDLKKKRGYRQSKVILYYGALSENKGVALLISVIPQIVARYSNVQFLFLPRHGRIQPWVDLVNEQQIEAQVQFITKDVAIEDYVNLADVVALPYLNLRGTDGNPSCLLEAMACGTPVVTADLPELREIAEGGVDFVKAGDAQELVEKIVERLQHPDVLKVKKGLGQAARFAVPKVGKEIEKIYSAVYSLQSGGQ